MTFLSELKRLRETPKTPSEYVSYGLWLIDHAEAIEELVRAAEMVNEFPNTGPATSALREALAKLEKP